MSAGDTGAAILTSFDPGAFAQTISTEGEETIDPAQVNDGSQPPPPPPAGSEPPPPDGSEPPPPEGEFAPPPDGELLPPPEVEFLPPPEDFEGSGTLIVPPPPDGFEGDGGFFAPPDGGACWGPWAPLFADAISFDRRVTSGNGHNSSHLCSRCLL